MVVQLLLILAPSALQAFTKMTQQTLLLVFLNEEIAKKLGVRDATMEIPLVETDVEMTVQPWRLAGFVQEEVLLQETLELNVLTAFTKTMSPTRQYALLVEETD